MPKLSSDRLPKYQKHRASGQAVVKLNGKSFYLGPHGTKSSRREFDRIVGEWQVNGRQLPASNGEPADLTINEVALAFWERHVKDHYVKNGEPTAEQRCFKSALRLLRQTYGHTAARDFGPLALKALREKMIGQKWSRKYVNKSVCRMRQLFRWAVSEQLLPVEVHQALQCVQGLQAGRTEARETTPRHVIPLEHVEKVRAVVKQRYRDLIDLALLTGARPGELIALTSEIIDTTGEVWTARLSDHKNVHHDKLRTLVFGPKAQEILRRYLNNALPGHRLFPITVNTFRDTIVEACERVGVERFTPHWLRHSAATRVREQFGVEGSQSILGHARLDMTELYAAKSEILAMQIAKQVG